MKNKLYSFLSAIALSTLLMTGCSGGNINKATETVQKVKDTAETMSNTAQNVKDNANEVQQNVVNTTNTQTVQSTPNQNKKLLAATIIRVVDGDTVKIKLNGKEETVRMLCIDTPESVSPKVVGGVQPFGKEASNFTKKSLYPGINIQIELGIGSGRDKYNRLLGYIYVDGKMYNETLLEKGLARVAYIYAPNTQYVDQFYVVQKKAQQKAIGIWSVENYATDRGYNVDAYNKAKNHTEKVAISKPSNPTSKSDCNIKGNISGSKKIYHMPGQQYYDVTKPEKMFCTEDEATKAGFRKSQR